MVQNVKFRASFLKKFVLYLTKILFTATPISFYPVQAGVYSFCDGRCAEADIHVVEEDEETGECSTDGPRHDNEPSFYETLGGHTAKARSDATG